MKRGGVKRRPTHVILGVDICPRPAKRLRSLLRHRMVERSFAGIRRGLYMSAGFYQSRNHTISAAKDRI